MIQRLFSTFPNGGPGTGLLLLRSCGGGQLILDGLQYVLNYASWGAHYLGFAQLLLGGMLALGWWTPGVSACAALLGVGLAISDNRWELHIAQVGIALGLLALGPGAWSVDARLYGRKHIDI
jgi:putative oxidoreductase